MKSKGTASGRNFYAEIKMELLGRGSKVRNSRGEISNRDGVITNHPKKSVSMSIPTARLVCSFMGCSMFTILGFHLQPSLGMVG